MNIEYHCDWCGTKLGKECCSNHFGGSFCSAKCSDKDESDRLLEPTFEELLAGQPPISGDSRGFDNVDAPRHYKYHDLDTFDFLKGGFAPEVFEGFLVGNVIKYIQRYPLKNGLEDLKKAQKYLDKLIELKDNK